MDTPWTLAIVASTALVSFLSFSNPRLLTALLLDARSVFEQGQGYRALTSGWVHANFTHLFVNMFSLWSFGGVIEHYYGATSMLTPYLAGIAGGSFLALWLHRGHEYRALGASGGVCGVVFASVLLEPSSSVYLFFIPIPIPGRIFVFLFLLYTWFGMRRGGDGIGHDAHFGGAIIGVLAAALMFPAAAVDQWYFLAALLVVASVLGVNGYRKQVEGLKTDEDELGR